MSPEKPHSHASTSGALAALGGFLAWGFFPLYWKQLEGINAAELIAHRIVWSLVFLGAVFLARRSGFGAVGRALKSRRLVGYSLLSGGLLTVNWLTYVWAVTHDYVIESSLGYFLVPLLIVVLGALVLGERLRALQWLAVGFAAAGVALILLGVGRLPWIALALAVSWSLYGLMRKRSALGALDGLMVETILYAPLAVACLVWREHTGNGAFGHADLRTHVLILSAGWVTALPLILFAYGARRIRLSTIGLMQYLTPTVQFLIGLLLYHEIFDAARFKACLLIWLGVAFYTADSFWAQRRFLRSVVAG